MRGVFAVGFAIPMEESGQEFPSSSSSDEVEGNSLSDEEENFSVTGEILAYQEETLANSDDVDSNIEHEEDADKDG